MSAREALRLLGDLLEKRRARAGTRAATPTTRCARPATTPRSSRRTDSRPCPSSSTRREGRREAKRLTASNTVPVLVTDDDEVVSDSKAIVARARENPAGATAAASVG